MHTRRAAKTAQKLVNRNVAVIKHFSCDKTATLTQTLMCRGPCVYSQWWGAKHIIRPASLVVQVDLGLSSRSVMAPPSKLYMPSWRGRFNYKSTWNWLFAKNTIYYTTIILLLYLYTSCTMTWRLACDRADRQTDRHLATAYYALCIASRSKNLGCTAAPPVSERKRRPT